MDRMLITCKTARQASLVVEGLKAEFPHYGFAVGDVLFGSDPGEYAVLWTESPERPDFAVVMTLSHFARGYYAAVRTPFCS